MTITLIFLEYLYVSFLLARGYEKLGIGIGYTFNAI